MADQAPVNAAQADKDKAEVKAAQETVKQDQAVGKDLAGKVEGELAGDYFAQQEAFGKAFEEKEGEDSFRRAARIEREREASMSAGDPTRDPVAKQAAMDANFVAPGALADAKKIKKVEADYVKTQSTSTGGVK